MLSPRWTKVMRDLAGHRFRTALVALSIAIGIFAVGLVLGVRAILIREFDADYVASAAPNATYYTSPIDDDTVLRAASYSGITAAQGRHEVSLRYRWSGSEERRTVAVVAYRDYRDIAVRRLVPEDVSGWPPARGEIYLERSALQVSNYKIDDILDIETSTGKTVPLKVAGFVHDLNATPAQFTGVETGCVSFDTLPMLDESEHYNELMVTLRGSGDGLTRESASRQAVSLREDVLESHDVIVGATQVPTPGSHFLGDIFKAVSLLLLALGVLSLGLSGFLVVNTVTSLMSQHVRQVGVMKAVGGRAGQVIAMYLVMVSAYGVVAIFIGLPAVAFAGRLFTDFAEKILNFRIVSYAFPRWVVALEIGVGLVVPLLAAWVPVRRGARMSVVRALDPTGYSSATFGHSVVDRLLGLLRGLPRPAALSIRNTFLRKGRLTLTLATLVLAAAVVMSVVSVSSSIDATIEGLDTWWNYDAQLSVSVPAMARDIEAQVLRVPGVAAVQTWSQHQVVFERTGGSENENLSLVGLPHDTTFVEPSLVSGRWLTAADTDAVVVNTDVIAEEPGIALGKRIKLTIAGRESTWRVVGVITGQLGGPVMYAGRAAVAEAIGDGGVDRVLVQGRTHSNAAQQTLLTAVESRLDDAGYQVVNTRTQTGLSDTVARELGILLTFLGIMAALLSAVGMIGLTGTMTLNVLESTREIGVMRAIGAQHRSIYQIYISEGLVVGFIAWAMGAVLSYPMSWALTRALAQTTKVPLVYRFSWSGVLVTLAAIAAISVVASILPAQRASRVSVSDAIAYE